MSAARPRPSLSVWMRAARPATLSASLSPVLVGSAIPASAGHFQPGVFLAAVAGAVLIQIGANLANDLFDFRKGADRADRLGPPRVTATGAVTPAEIGVATAVVLATSALCGLYLVAAGGLPVLLVGIASIVAALTYVGGPWPYGYHGLGDLACFVFFGVVPIATLDYLHAGEISGASLAASLATAAAITAILVVNNLRDIAQDRTAGKHTLAVLVGERATRLEWAALVTLAYAVPPAGAAAGLWGWGALATWATLPLAWNLAARLRGSSGRALNPLLRDTARLQLLFAVLFSAGLLLPA